jgi:putative Mg2+ transporter-C (MgtC) family protein
MAAQVVSGIGFLGGGLIFREGLSVRGLNTAATLWCSAAVGTLCGVGYPLAAALCVAAVMCRTADEGHLRSLLLAAVTGSGLSLRALHSEDVEPAGKVQIRATLIGQGPQDVALERVVSRLSLEPGVTGVTWEVLEQDEVA